MIIDIAEEHVLRNDPSDYAETFFAAAAQPATIIRPGCSCSSSSHVAALQ
jgi:hypothetical protein